MMAIGIKVKWKGKENILREMGLGTVDNSIVVSCMEMVNIRHHKEFNHGEDGRKIHYLNQLANQLLIPKK